MLFNSLEFVVFFVVVILSLYFIRKITWQHLFLLVSSYFFFYFTSNYLIILLLISTIVDYIAAQKIFESKKSKNKKIILLSSLACNLGLLGFFKYADFGITQINTITESFGIEPISFLNLALPIGISFYTFQTISYTVDVYRGKLTPAKSFKEFMLFVAFFPQLVAGPIIRASEFLPQLSKKLEKGHTKFRQILVNNQNLKFGISLMAIGFLKKMFFADNISPLVNDIFTNPIGLDSSNILLGTLGFGIQIYCDFSGYSDIAIGAAVILGFKIPKNFNRPYFASSPSEFWRRWHISLSTWLRDYLYIPLGGNKKSKSRTYLNLGIVMLLGGLWHGASWNFVIWGGLHGAYLAIHRFISDRFPKVSEFWFFKNRIGKLVTIIIMQYLVFLAWIPFRVSGIEEIKYSMYRYVFWQFDFSSLIEIVLKHKIPSVLIILFLVVNIISYKNPNYIERFVNLRNSLWTAVLIVISLSILFLMDQNQSQFIYFRF